MLMVSFLMIDFLSMPGCRFRRERCFRCRQLMGQLITLTLIFDATLMLSFQRHFDAGRADYAGLICRFR